MPTQDELNRRAPQINWDRPLADEYTVPDVASAQEKVRGRYRLFDPALGVRPSVVQVDGDGVVMVYRLPSGGKFRSDGRIRVQQTPAEPDPRALVDTAAPPPGAAAYPGLESSVVTIGALPARLLVNTSTNVARVLIEVDGVRVDITGPDSPPEAVIDIATRVLASPRL